jgi:TPP-dependent pyruvate/acetoin dehydrogenase alpha subunit
MPEQIPELPLSQLRSMLSTMYRIRAFEEKVDELFMYAWRDARDYSLFATDSPS